MDLYNGDGDVAKLAKEMADMLYVIYGTFDLLGLPADKVFNEVHRSNMSKLGPDGLPVLRSDGKVLKGPNYSEADIEAVLSQ
jgi:predicted HAD superfamily Cof-like phosphohydrolase